jgi:hypothetical protein
LDWYREYRRRGSLKTLFGTQTRALRFRLTVFAESVTSRFGQHDQEFIEWAVQQLRDFRDTEEQRRIGDSYSKLLSSSQAVQAYHSMLKEKAKGALAIPSVLTHAYDALLESLHLLSTEVQREVLDSLHEIALLNFEVQQASDYLRMTFQPGMDGENYGCLQQNLKHTYAVLGPRARRTADALKRVEQALA